MKIAIIIFLIIALLMIFYTIWISVKSLNQIKQRAKQDFEADQKQKIRHPQIDKELTEIAKQRQALNAKKSAKKKK